jgi:hypothetical protein
LLAASLTVEARRRAVDSTSAAKKEAVRRAIQKIPSTSDPQNQAFARTRLRKLYWDLGKYEELRSHSSSRNMMRTTVRRRSS